MTTSLRVTLGQASLAGTHDINQDFHGALLPAGHLLASKGIVLAIADTLKLPIRYIGIGETAADTISRIEAARAGDAGKAKRGGYE